MIRHISPSRILVALGIVLLITPALFPVQPILFHETRPGTVGNATELEQAGITVVAYDDLSPRGQELYVRSLQSRGEYGVPVGEGASDFDYSSGTEDAEVDTPRRPRMPGGIAIERPPDADLPPADEPVELAERQQARERAQQQRSTDAASDNETAAGNETESGPTIEERRQQIARYDLMSTRTGPPPLTAGPNLVRLLSVVGGVIALGVGGYFSSRP